MRAILEKKFTKNWQALKSNPGMKSDAWFKKADAVVSKKLEAYQKAAEKARSGLIADLLKLGKALQQLEEAFVDFVDERALARLGEDCPAIAAHLMAIGRYKAKVLHERAMFDSRLRAAVSAADNDIKKLDSLDVQKKKELWKGFGIDL